MVQDRWRPAGFRANRVASAAMAFLVHDAGNDFSNTNMAWSVCLFKKREFYWNKKDNLYVVCLGALGYAFIGWPCECHNNDEDIFLRPRSDVTVVPWEINVGLGATCSWEYVPTSIQFVNAFHIQSSAVVSGPHQPILQAGLKRGMFLTRDQIVLIMQTLKLAMPTTGSGEKGQVWKKDLVKAMLSQLFPDETQEAKQHMYGCLMGSKTATFDDNEVDFLPDVTWNDLYFAKTH